MGHLSCHSHCHWHCQSRSPVTRLCPSHPVLVCRTSGPYPGRGGGAICFKTPIVNQFEDLQLGDAVKFLEVTNPNKPRNHYKGTSAILPFYRDWVIVD